MSLARSRSTGAHFPLTLSQRAPMEFVEQPRLSGACNLLEVPGLSSLDVDDDEGEVVIGIRPKSSPLPRRRSSVSDEDSEPEPPLCGSRRVSFADAKGLSLVQVKEFETWDVPMLPRYDFSESEGKDTDKYVLSLLTFSLPLSTEELFIKVRDQKVELETIELLPGTTILKGVIRVLNISFTKAVYVRTTLDTWSSHFDLLAEYIPGSSDGLMDCFSFKLTLVPPFGEQGARVDFCLRYETPVGTFWSNNNNRNYVLFCHKGMREQKETPQKENMNKKSCLKSVSQSFTMEDISAAEDSSQENISSVVSKQGEEVNTDKQISDDQPGTLEKDEQKLQAENTQNSSRRSRRKAARMARVRDYFSQRDGGANDNERDESPPEAKQATHEETPVEKHAEMQSFYEASSKSEGFQFVSESLKTCSEPLTDVLNDTSEAHNYTSNSEPEKSENSNLADSATLTGGESATNIPDNPLHSNEEPASAECQNINKSVSKAEGKNTKQGIIYECTSNVASEPADSVISPMSSESCVGQTNSFTFGNVVTPLYHQVFGRVGSENQSVGDRGNLVTAMLYVRDLTQSAHHIEVRESSCTAATDVRSNNDRVQENVIKTQESNQECLDSTTNSAPIEEQEEEKESSSSVKANDILDSRDNLQDPAEIIYSDQRCTNTYEVLKPISGDTEAYPHTGNILNINLVKAAVPEESLYTQGELQEDNMTSDLQVHAIAETAQAQLPKHKCSQIKTNLDETLAQIETQEVMTSLETSFLPHQPSLSSSECASNETVQHTSSSEDNDYKCVDETNTDNEIGKTLTISTTNAISEDDKLLEALYDLNPNPIDNSITKETANSYISCCEIADKNDFTTHETSLETQEGDNVEEQNQLPNYSYEHETKQSAEIEVGDEVTESMTKVNHIHGDMFVQFKDEEPVIASEIIEHCEMEATVSKQDDFSFAEPTEVKNCEMMVEEEEENVLTNEEESKAISLKAGDNEAVEKEFEYIQATQVEVIAGEDETVEETEVEIREEKEKHFTEMQEVNTESIHVQNEEEIEAEEESEIDLKGEDKAGVEREDQLKPREENVEDKNWDYKEEMLFEAGQAELMDAVSEGMTLKGMEDGVGCFEERLDITQNKLEDGLSALVNNLQDRKKENTEGQYAHTLSETDFYKEEDFQSNKNIAHHRSKAENESAAAEGCLCILTNEPESDQTSHDSASAESDSDDEVELYMHCLRAVHSKTEAPKDNKDASLTVSKRPTGSRSKNMSIPMPSISESEEQHLSCLQDSNENMERLDIQPTATALSDGREYITRSVSWWKNCLSCSSISKTLLYAILLVIFLVVAYHYDFLACFGLYLVSLVWLCFQGETQPVKNNNRVG